MKVNNVAIYDTFAEAWTLEVMRVLLTAMTPELALGCAYQFAGAAGSSMIGSRVNAGIERTAAPDETPDNRPGVYVSLAMTPENREPMLQEFELRVALASLVPTVAVYDAAVDCGPAVSANIHDKFTMSASRWTGHDAERRPGRAHAVRSADDDRRIRL